MLHRRGFLAGVFSAFAAPAIVRVESIMPVRSLVGLSPDISLLYAELQAVTRKAFMPRLFAQIYYGNPALNAMLDMQA